ncbi:MAG: hypothetical protein ABIP75_03045 [Pyrinomonadaceae bacterium]
MLVNLKCLNCGAALTIPEGVAQMACGYCGVQQVVQREGGGVWLSLEKALADVKATADRTNSELTLRRLKEERDAASQRLDELRNQVENSGLQGIAAIAQIPAAVLVFGAIIYVISSFWSTGTAGSGGLFTIVPLFIVIVMVTMAIGFGVNLARSRAIKADAESEEIALESQISELDQKIEETRRRVSL